MTAGPLTIQPDQRARECGCPTWVLRCAHWNGLVLLHHFYSEGSYKPTLFICVSKEWTNMPGLELSAKSHGGLVLISLYSDELWSQYEQSLLAGELDEYFP